MWFLFLILMCSIANADVYVLTDSTTAVKGLSEQNDMVIPSGYKISILKGQTISNLPISGDSSLYNFNNGSFSLNTSAVQAQQAAQRLSIANQTATQNAQLSAIQKLTDAISKVASQDVLTQQEMRALLPNVNVSIGTTQP